MADERDCCNDVPRNEPPGDRTKAMAVLLVDRTTRSLTISPLNNSETVQDWGGWRLIVADGRRGQRLEIVF